MNVTALLAHPDDEVMCAGILAKFIDAGDNVTLVTAFSDEMRSEELSNAVKVLGIQLIELFGHESHVTWEQKIVKRYEPIVMRTEPELLLSQRVADNNTSHVPLALTMRTIARKNRISLWEIDAAIPGGIETEALSNNLLVDIDKQADRKYAAMACYTSAVRRYPGWVDAMRNRDQYNGWLLNMSAETHYAEAARIHKSVWR